MFKKTGVYSYVSGSEALNDPGQVGPYERRNRSSAQCQVPVGRQDLESGKRIDELFSGTLSLMSTKMAIVHVAKVRRTIVSWT